MPDQDPNPSDSQTDPLSEGLRTWAAAWSRVAREMSGFAAAEDLTSAWFKSLESLGTLSSQSRSSSSRADDHDPLTPLVHLYLESAGSALRYCGRYTESWSRYFERLAGRVSNLSEEDLTNDSARLLVDEARAMVRELGDFATQEARLMSLEMERISLRLGEMLGESQPGQEQPAAQPKEPSAKETARTKPKRRRYVKSKDG